MRSTRTALAILAATFLLTFVTASSLRPVEAADRTAPLAAQTNPPAPPTLQVYSRETVVDVIVTGEDGQPVHGLTQADFTVKENGKEQPIDSFAEFAAGAAGPEPAPLQSPDAQPEAHSSYQSAPASGPVNILLIDALNAGPGSVIRAQRDTVKYLKTMPEGTEVAVFWLSPAGLRLLRGFTSDRKLLMGAVSRGGGFGQPVENWTRMWLTTDAMDEISVYVSKIKGRKNLIWFTPGMPVPLIRDGGYGWGGTPDMGLVHRLMDAYELLTRAQVAICPVDPRGVGVRMDRTTLLAEAVAEGSGGTAYYNTNDLAAAVGDAIAKGSEYYTLSYVPPGTKDDGRYHTIWVGVDRPGAHLVYRKGYDSEDPLSDHPIAPGPGLKQAVAAGRALTATGVEMQFDVKVQPIPLDEAAADPAPATTGRRLLPRGAKPGVKYGILYQVPVSQIAFTRAADGARLGSLEFDVAAYTANGVMTNIVSEKIRLPLSAEEYAEFIKTPFHYFQQLVLPLGETMVQVGILDDVSKKTGTMDIPLEVAKHPPIPAVASTPTR